MQFNNKLSFYSEKNYNLAMSKEVKILLYILSIIAVIALIVLLITPKLFPPAEKNSDPESNEFTLAQVQAHNSSDSCYSIIDNQVYDFTNWINLHPGGDESIENICGKDGTELFLKVHKDIPSYQGIFDKYKIGTLINNDTE